MFDRNESGINVVLNHERETFGSDKHLSSEESDKYAKRERLLRSIISSSVKTLEVEKIINYIVTEMGKLFKADRCFFVGYDSREDSSTPLESYAEYVSSSDIRSHLTRQANKEDITFFMGPLKRKETVYVENIYDIDLPNASKKMLIDDLSVKSYLVVQVFNEEQVYGSLVFHYVNDYMKFSIGDIKVIEAIASQSALIIRQANLYRMVHEQATKDKFLREIVSSMGSTFDFNEIRKSFLRMLGDFLKSDFTVLHVKDIKTNKFLPIDEYSVHLSSNDIKIPVGVNIISDYEWTDIIFNNLNLDYLAYSDLEDMKRDFNLYGTRAAASLDEYGFKSMIVVPVLCANNFLGVLVLGYIKNYRAITKEDVDIVRVVANHAGISLYQSKLYQESQEASEAKSEFIANMSHEIRTPLNVIIGFSELLSTQELSREKQVKYLQNINNSGKHLLSLTNDIINIAKIESGNFELKCEKIKTDLLIKTVVSSVKLLAESKNISIIMELCKAKIYADKKILLQILFNLLSNAIKFTNEGGVIVVKSEVNGSEIVISVEDNGIGIDSKDWELIFDEFKQVDSSVERTQQGAGLGLAIAKKLVELHNGKINVVSQKGKGSKFWFELPM